MNSSRYHKLSVHPHPRLTRYFLNNTALDTQEIMRRVVIDKLVIYIVCSSQAPRLPMAIRYSDE